MIALGTALMCLACGGFVPGSEVAGADLQNNTPYVLTFTATGDEVLWLEYDLTHSKPYRVTGTVDIQTPAGLIERHYVDFTEDGSPIVGRGGRITFATTRVNKRNNAGSATGTIKMMELDSLTQGATIEIQGTLIADQSTTLNSARLKVTQ